MKPIKQTLLSGAIILALSLVFTSCDDILGEWSKPTPVTPVPKTAGTISYAETSFLKGSLDPAFTNPLTMTGDGTVSYESSNTAVASVDATGKVTITGPGTTTIKAKVSDSDTYTYATSEATYTLEVQEGYSYLKWDDMAKKLVSAIETNYQEVSSSTSSTMIWDGSKVLVVKDADVEITSDIYLSGDTKIILCDGAKLTTKTINGYLPTNHRSLTIYGQSAQTGQLITQPSASSKGFYEISELNIHGGVISANGNTGVTLQGGSQALNVYGGKLTARGTSFKGIQDCKAINILGGAVEAYGVSGFDGIYILGGSIITVSNDGRLKAVGGDGTTVGGGNGINGALVAKDNAVVEVFGGHATSGDLEGGSAIIGGDVEIRDNASVTLIAGNSSGTKDGVNANPNNVYYYGGTLIAIGGAKGDSGTKDGKGIGHKLTNSSGGTIYYATNTDGSLTDFSNPTAVTTGASVNPTTRGVKVYK
jgi:hypothetical protein